MSTTFRELGILPETAEALEAVGIVTPFPIQEMTLPVALSGTDVIGQAKTGTGKTLGFGLPILERVVVPADVEAGRATPEQLIEAPQALVVVPTRELCQQVTNDLLTAGKVRNVRVLAIYGGRAYEPQVEALKKGVDVVVGTPGRLLDLAGQRKLDLSNVKTLVLDEADEMLDLGFLPDVEKIINMLPAKRQTMLFSATMPGAVIGLARRYMSKPTHIRATSPDDEGATHANITQHVFRAHSMDKPELVARVLQARGRGLAMIFCRTKRTAADIAEQLERRGFASGAVHGDLGQGAREQALRAFRNGKVDVLVATDVAARGIDVEGVTHVINYQTPEDEKTYLHRIGRTGRAGASGTAITLVDWDDIPRWQLINKALQLNFNDPVETYSSSPHLYEQLDIPAGTKGILPRAERTRAGLDAEEIEDLGEPGGRRGRGGRQEKAAEERPALTRTPRQRRRTRGGETFADGVAAATAPAAPATDDAEAVAGPRRPRRRRTRGGAGAGIPVAGAAPATPVSSVEAAEPAKTAEPEPSAPEAPAPVSEGRPRRRRTRGTEARTTEVTAEVAPEAPAEAVAEARPVRTATANAAEEAPRRRRGRGTRAEAAESAPQPVNAPAETPAAPEPVVAAPAAEAGRGRRSRGRGRPAEAASAQVAAAAEPRARTVAAPTRAPRKRPVRPRVEDSVSFQTVETAAAALAAATVVPAQVSEEPKPVRTAAPAVVPAQVAAAPVSAPRGRRRVTRPATNQVVPVAAPKTEEPQVAEVPAAPAEEPKPVRRRATRRVSSPVTTTASVGAVVIVEAPKAVAEEPVAPEPKKAAPRKRTVKKAVAEPAAEAAVTEAEAPKKAAPRKRATAKKAAATAEAATEAPTAEETAAPEPKKAAPRKRATAKKALTTAEAATEAPTAEETAPKKAAPRKRTVKKAVAEPAAEAAVTEAEAPKKAAPRKRATTKKAVAAVAPDASEPKTTTRRRTTKKVAEAAEVAADAPAEEPTAEKAAPRRRAAKKAAAPEA